MSEDSDLERTEQPTPKKREDARRDGQLPQSKELSTAVALIGAAAMVQLAGPHIGASLFNVFASGMSGMFGADVDPLRIVPYIQQTGLAAFAATAPVLAAFAGTALLVGGAQGRGNLTTKPLEPKWERLDVVKNAKNLYGKKPWVELARSLMKMTVVIVALRWALASAWPEIVSLTQQAPAAAIALAHTYVVKLLATAGAAYIVLGLLDYGYQIWENEQKMRMTREEVKREMKQAEVDPLIRQRMRSAARDRIRHQMFDKVATADVVLVNPTRIAVALRYDQSADMAPVVVAMGQELIAQRIRELAAEHNVPVIENKPVARALFATAQVGSEIPPDLYTAIIEIYAFVIRQRAPRRWDA